jgi:ATP-dependent protease ClpP protease subunit/nitrate reductase NapAB chaperone NapD
MATPRLIIDKDIAAFDTFAAMFGVPQPVFSASSVSEFLTANADATEIVVEIRSDGGSTTEARVIYDLLKNSGKKITTEGYKVNSSAVIPFLAGDERLISDNADFIIHPVWIDAMSLPWKLEAEDLQDFANEIKAEQTKLLDIYVGVIGEDKREEVAQLMADSTNLTNDKAISLGFATGKLGGVAPKSENKRSLAFSNRMASIVINSKSDQMNKVEAALAAMNNRIGKLLNLTMKNKAIALSEGGDVYVAEGDEIAEGVAVFTDEALETPAPDGDHQLADGQTITVVGGVITAVATAGAPDAEDKTKDIEAVNAKIASMEAAQVAIIESVNKLTTAIEAQNATIGKFQNLVPAAKPTATPDKVNTVADVSKMTVAQRVALAHKNKK